MKLLTSHKIIDSSYRKRVIDMDTGIIRWISEISIEPGEPEIFNYSAKMADTGKYLPIRCYDNNGGAGLTREEASLAAIGEAIERYCCSVYFKEDLILGTYAEVKKYCRALGPEEIALFHPKQKEKIRYTLFTEDTKICWTRGYSITKKEPILIPSCLVYIPYYPFLRDNGEETIGPSISTGQASAYNYNDALLRGIYEIVERDTFMITWLNQLPIPKIDIYSSLTLSKIFREKFAKTNLQYTLYHMTTDLEIPSVLCLLIDNSRNPPMICAGGASNLDPEKAALKALVEAAQTREWAKFLGKQKKPLIIESDFSNIDDFEKHVFLYAYGDMMHAIKFLINGKKKISFSDIPNLSSGNFIKELKHVLSKLQSDGYEVMVVDLTTTDVGECGYRVLKVLIPLFQHLEGDHNHRFLGGKRIYQVPNTLGYSIKSDFKTLNPNPHPYP